MSTFEERARAAGYTDRDTQNTRDLIEKIKKALDGDPFMAPECQYPPEIRLARLFIDEYKQLIAKADVGLVRWLDKKMGCSQDIIEAVQQSEHWKWIQTHPE
jgi:hypothetical protein